jgi:hypothetical protein
VRTSLFQDLRDLIGLLSLLTLFALLSALSIAAQGQTPQPEVRPASTLVTPQNAPSRPGQSAAARDSELYCAGYIEHDPTYTAIQIVGGEEEQEQYIFSPGDNVYIKGGSRLNVRVGDEFAVIRPRGQFESKWSRKGRLGVFTQEVGRLRVLKVLEEVSVAVVVHACDTLLLADLLRPAPPSRRTSPPARTEDEFDRFADPTGKAVGRIVAARDFREMIAVEQVVYVDLGTEDNVRLGDKLTVYRPVGKGSVNRFREEEVTPAANYGFESEVFRGGQFSIKAPRVQDPARNSPKGPIQTTAKVKRQRPRLPRKNVGEMVVINVQRRTATAIITRLVQEIHTGDYVEVK